MIYTSVVYTIFNAELVKQYVFNNADYNKCSCKTTTLQHVVFNTVNFSFEHF